ncbi:hypothetical protein WI28_05405 [Burkholderia diffusa]|nr:hypothetical protein WI28_05405 [Burkholderia diffusa]
MADIRALISALNFEQECLSALAPHAAGFDQSLFVAVRKSLASGSRLLTIGLRCDMIALPLLRWQNDRG